jgi:hypothetical protein
MRDSGAAAETGLLACARSESATVAEPCGRRVLVTARLEANASLKFKSGQTLMSFSISD